MYKFKLLEALPGKKIGDILECSEIPHAWDWEYKKVHTIVKSTSPLVEEVKPVILSLRERVKTIEDVYSELKRKQPKLSDYKFLPESKREYALNNQYIEDIVELFNEGWKVDFSNRNQYKYYPYFEKGRSGWVLYGVYGICLSSFCGSGFYYKDRETAQYCATQFLSIYKKILD